MKATIKLVICSIILLGLTYTMLCQTEIPGGQNKIINNLPSDFPLINIKTNNNPASGYYFFGLMPVSDTNTIYSNYVMVIDNTGSPVAIKKTGLNFTGLPLNFMQSPDGMLIHIELDFDKSEFFVSDTTLKPVDSLSYPGFQKYISYFRKLPNGNSLLIKNEFLPYDLSQVFEGGEPNGFISTSSIYELDKNKNIVYKWRALDYFPLNETYSVPNSCFHNHAHINSIILDNDGNLIISSRLLSEVTKINRLTGQIMWRLGGRNNQFEFVNENQENSPLFFSYQGDFRRLPNGNVTLFDNGNQHNPPYSRCAEYKLDEKSMTAELVWEYRNTPDIFVSKYGSCQRQINGNTVIGWGIAASDGTTAITEVTPENEIAFEASFPKGLYSSRALKYPINFNIPDFKKTEELLEKNTYKFKEGSRSVCVSAKIIKLDAFFYAFLKGEKFGFAPMDADFDGPIPPVVFPKRIVLTPQEIDSLYAELRFDTKCLGINNRNNEYKIFRRDKSGTGKFMELPTTYDDVTGELVTSTSSFGEFVLGIPWKEEKPLAPILNWPPDNFIVNVKEPVYLECSPRGYFQGCVIQIALDKDFVQIVHLDSTRESTFRASLLLEDIYYWRVKSFLGKYESDWSEIYTFTAANPFFDVKYPDGGEILSKDTIRKIIRWDKNIYDSVKVELLRNGVPVHTIADSLICFTGAFSWIIPAGIIPDSTYKIRVSSIEDNTVFSASESNFTITDKPTAVEEFNIINNWITISPNPASGNAEIKFSTETAGNVNITIYDLLGNPLVNVVNTEMEPGVHSIIWKNTSLLPGAYYCKLEAVNQNDFIKLIIIR